MYNRACWQARAQPVVDDRGQRTVQGAGKGGDPVKKPSREREIELTQRSIWNSLPAFAGAVVAAAFLLLPSSCSPEESAPDDSNRSAATPSPGAVPSEQTVPVAVESPVPSPPRPGEIAEEISRGLETWEALGINSYTIEVMEVSIWHMQVHTVTVKKSRIADASATCSPAPLEFGSCQLRDFVPESYIVPGLFAEAFRQASVSEGAYSRITLDPTYGFPNLIRFDDPRAVDEESTWRVVSFEPEDG